jgi:hypothetical protein
LWQWTELALWGQVELLAFLASFPAPIQVRGLRMAESLLASPFSSLASLASSSSWT